MLKDNQFSCVSRGKFTLFIDINDNVWISGEIITDKHEFPKKISGLTNIYSIDCGTNHAVCLDFDGNVFTFGENYSGKLGIGKRDIPHSKIPIKIDIPPIQQISCGKNFTICLSYENQLWAFGVGEDSQLGLGDTKCRYSPSLNTVLNNIDTIICGGYRAFCRNINDEYFAWGYGMHGQLGIGIKSTNKNPVKISQWPDNIISLKIGTHSTLLLTNEGKVYACGWNVHGQLGCNSNVDTYTTPTLINDLPYIKQIECGENYSFCLDIDDKLWVFGMNSTGQLGLGDSTNRNKPTLNESLTNIIGISHGGAHRLVKTSSNEIFGFGNNSANQLGEQTQSASITTPIRVLKDKEDIWKLKLMNSRQKSARK